ncbi:uncharacterized protein LOC110204398 isoform X3 [Phascolarctos cinereus]
MPGRISSPYGRSSSTSFGHLWRATAAPTPFLLGRVEVPVFSAEEESPGPQPQEPIPHEGEQDKVSIKSLDVPGRDRMSVQPEIITAAAAEEGFPSPGGTETELLPPHYTIHGVPSVSPPSTRSVTTVAMAAAASKGPASNAMAGAPAGMGTATAGSQGPGLSVALAGTTTGQVTETAGNTWASSGSLMLAGAASMSSGTSSLIPSGHMSMASAGAGSFVVARLGSVTPLGPERPLVSTLHTEGYMSERDGSQRVAMASPKVAKKDTSSRRHSRHRKGQARRRAKREGGSGQRRSSRQAATSKETQKSSRHSPSSRKATSRSPSVKDSSHCLS